MQKVNPRVSSEECSDRIDAEKVILNRDLARIGINLDAVSGVARRQDKTTPKEPVARQQESPALAGDPGNSNQGNSRGLSGGEHKQSAPCILQHYLWGNR